MTDDYGIEHFDPAKLFHLGYVVANIDRALSVWRRMGALLVVPPAPDPIQRVACALMSFQGAALIELVAPLDDNSPIRGRLSKGGGLDHVCLFSDNLQADLVDLETQGGSVVVPPCHGEVFDRELAFVLTRAGLVVELMSRTPTGKLLQDPLDRIARLRS